MLKFQEAVKCGRGSAAVPTLPGALIARRYVLREKLGSGSFGTVYLVSDKKADGGEELKVLKAISVGELHPNESVQASMEAQLLARLDHPAIVKFHASFVERDSFCIVTEYCEGRDLDCKIQEYREAGKTFPESQIMDWFIQLLLGVAYMHERRLLHRDLKSKNIFLKNNLIKIGDFGVSRLLMGSCDLATTLAGTPHYMSPEVLKHQGYDTKSDIWSLACILYEMCCMNHAFVGSNFLSVVLKIVEGATPSLPERYPRELNAVLGSMLNKSPALRPSAVEILKVPYISEQLQRLMCRYSEMSVEDKNLNCQKEAARVINAVTTKAHLQTLRALSEVQEMTPREKMRLPRLQAAGGTSRKLKKITEEKYESSKRMLEMRSWKFQQPSVDGLCEFGVPASHDPVEPQLTPSLNAVEAVSHGEAPGADLGEREIPEDPLVAEEYYAEGFDSCSEDGEEELGLSGSEEDGQDAGLQAARGTSWQDSDVEALVKCLENVLGCTSLDSRTITGVAADVPRQLTVFNSAMAETRVKRMRESAVQKLGAEMFDKVYSYLKRARQQQASDVEVQKVLEELVPRASECFEVDQLLYFEEQLLLTMGEGPLLRNFC
ncbi:PREDICTED: serine/threonine-protein kinase Nek11 [Elephantulus edwardii]|uniref:serine/threonine-protein kinase Nek11 n=1 Tax=Elephantulus edwardii TaxID=28737 RepID=UPI0003F06339|nr:PREDICTED: serine/threonine-protein kinase Nek11 [Elephantulus edwardii]